MKIFSLLKKLNFHITRKHYHKLLFLLILMFFSAASEVISIGAIMPFLAVIVSPETLFTYVALKPFLEYFSITSAEDLVLPTVITFAFAAITAGFFRLALLWHQTRISYSIGVDLCVKAYKNTLNQPYEYHVSKNTSEIISGISIKAQNVANNTVLPIVNIISSCLSLSAIFTALFLIDPIVALVSIVAFGLIYSFVALYSNKKLARESEKINFEQNKIIKELQEGLGDIRDVLLDGSQEMHAQFYYETDSRLRRALGNVQILGSAPRYFVEAIGIAFVAAIAYWLIQQSSNIGDNFIILGAFAMAAQRVLPMVQQIYLGITSIYGNSAALNEVINLLHLPNQSKINFKTNSNFKFENIVEFKNVSFKYKSRDKGVIENFNFKIPKGSHIGIIGETGSGKSTILDILMGLLTPNVGQLVVDDIIISENNKRKWQSNIGHVPQNIYLTDTSIAENITMNAFKNEIDENQLEFAIKVAQLDKVLKNLPLGINTIVGERGGLLSGGQRQRIGIARALYKDPKILILDEATSALDIKTEANLIKGLRSIQNKITIVTVTHKIDTLKHCDKIIKMNEGNIEKIGQYLDFV